MENFINKEKLVEAVSKEFSVPLNLISQDAITNAYYNYERIEKIGKWIEERVDFKPLVAVVCGSGLGEIANLVEGAKVIAYENIPDFPRSTVNGHSGNLVFGYLSEMPVVCMQGRFHPYEGYSLALCAMPVKVFKYLGVKMIILTNAAGGLNSAYQVGDLMLIKDHLSFPMLCSFGNPLAGPNDERFGPRFLPINKIYSKKLRELFLQCAHESDILVHEGVYGSINGPTYETTSDGRLCKIAGMDSVGMSTTHEAVVAYYCGLKVLAFSIITDLVSLDFEHEEEPDHDEILKVASDKAKDAETIVFCFLKKLSKNLSLIE